MDESFVNAIHSLTAYRELDSHIPAVVLPPGCTVESLEEYERWPSRQILRVNVCTIDDFCAYMAREAHIDGVDKENLSAVLISPDGDGATGVIDFGTEERPMWKQHRIRLSMRKTPAFEALMDIARGPINQIELSDFIEDWDDLTLSHGDVTLDRAKAVAAVRSVTVEQLRKADFEVGDFESRRSALDEVKASSGAGKLPSRMELFTPVYEGMNCLMVTARVSILTAHDKPTFRVRILGREDLMKRCKDDIKREVVHGLPENGLRIFVGTI